MYNVFIHGLELHAFHGVTEEERSIGHRFRVDVELDVQGGATATDRVEDTCDYAAVCRVVSATLLETPFKTVERAADHALARILADFPMVQKAQMALSKLQPAIAENVQAVGVSVVRTRDTQ